MDLRLSASHGIMLANMTEAMDTIIEKRQDMLDVPKVGELVSGAIIDKARNAMYVDLGKLGVGVIYGRDLLDDIDAFKKSNLGDPIEATVASIDNEDDLIELSLKSASLEKNWTELKRLLDTGEVIETVILDANKGGLIVKIKSITGFIPVSQLSPEHYPRVEGGDKSRILEKLNTFVGQTFKIKIIGADQESEKLIVSEKAAVSDEISQALSDIKIGDVVSGTISGLVDFGAFLKFNINGKDLEGLVHISELAWQRIDNPSDIVSVGDDIKTKVIGIDGIRISLSIKQLQHDPWEGLEKKYNIGDKITGEVIKITPFGAFVKLDDDIHGLVHISEIPKNNESDASLSLNIGDKKVFTIISMQTKEHRLGLSMRTIEKDKKDPK